MKAHNGEGKPSNGFYAIWPPDQASHFPSFPELHLHLSKFVPGHPLAQIHCITPMRVDVLLGEILMSQNDTPCIG